MSATRLRCAIYTRKSSDEGLEQDFNSLDAQREACEAYIASQASLGWRALADRYDDGGISGGTLERPALRRLLADVGAGKIDVVVVYKIDRLTRSLTDFSKIVEVFDARAVSFVSVTQAFNTTSSMGRLTLNVLLSFAQFEREVTGERIRDKIAASKRKGMWMGGVVPLGYDVQDRKLIINVRDAATVRTLFELYLQSRSIRRSQAQANALGLRTRQRTGAKSGDITGGCEFSCGHLKTILSNPIYIGRIRHRNECFDGQHPPIVDQDTFEEVQRLLSSRANRNVNVDSRDGIHLLSGLLFDEDRDQLGPTHATKAGKRYRYYVSRRLLNNARSSNRAQGWRVPATQLDDLVCEHLQRFLRSPAGLIAMTSGWCLDAAQVQRMFAAASARADELQAPSPVVRKAALNQLIKRVVVGREAICIHFATETLAERSGAIQRIAPDEPATHIITVPVALKRRGVEARLVVGEEPSTPDQALIRLIARSHIYMTSLTDGAGMTIAHLAEREQLDVSDLSRILRLAYLAPDITEAILVGKQPPEITPRQLMRIGELPLDWQQQHRHLGF